jgi:NADH:ubiquinone oxidoreductase subunit 3 (subunit A)
MEREQMPTKLLSTRTLGTISLLSGATFFFLLLFPYYYYPGRQAYIPKTNPDLGYFLPKSSEAWAFLILALAFLTLSIGALALFIRTKARQI